MFEILLRKGNIVMASRNTRNIRDIGRENDGRSTSGGAGTGGSWYAGRDSVRRELDTSRQGEITRLAQRAYAESLGARSPSGASSLVPASNPADQSVRSSYLFMTSGDSIAEATERFRSGGGKKTVEAWKKNVKSPIKGSSEHTPQPPGSLTSYGSSEFFGSILLSQATYGSNKSRSFEASGSGTTVRGQSRSDAELQARLHSANKKSRDRGAKFRPRIEAEFERSEPQRAEELKTWLNNIHRFIKDNPYLVTNKYINGVVTDIRANTTDTDLQYLYGTVQRELNPDEAWKLIKNIIICASSAGFPNPHERDQIQSDPAYQEGRKIAEKRIARMEEIADEAAAEFQETLRRVKETDQREFMAMIEVERRAILEGARKGVYEKVVGVKRPTETVYGRTGQRPD
jgi:hypothetical protein